MVEILVLLHVLSAIIGVGPTFFGHILYRKGQTLEQIRHAVLLGKKLEWFPKIGGMIAVLSGIFLVWVGNYGSFLQLWLIGSLVLYLIIQVIVITAVKPRQDEVEKWILDPSREEEIELPEDLRRIFREAEIYYAVSSSCGILLFIFMILRV